jgi:hypothetical protein
VKRICVFCGSNHGINSLYRHAAEELGQLLAERGHGLVYGGGGVGLMGVVADAVLAGGGEVIGVIPEVLATKELAHPNVTAMHVVPGMHARKARMVELADAFVAMPGGYGTFDELFEVITWAQLGIHHKPIGLLNVAGYFDVLVGFIDHAVAEGFIKPVHRQLIVTAEQPTALLEALIHHKMPAVRKWITPEQT